MEAFIVHYSKNTERRRVLEADKGLSVFSKVTWIDWYDKDDPICAWIAHRCKSQMSLGLISNSLKHYEAFRLIVERGLSSAFIFEDDVVFQDDWLQKFTDSGGFNPTFVKLDCLHTIPWAGPMTYRVGNPGGSEARFVRREFAEDILKHVDFNHSPDIVHGAYCEYIQIPIVLVPVCTQTSIIEAMSSHESNNIPSDWREYIRQYCSRPHEDYSQLLVEYNSFCDLKLKVEDEFFRVYSRRVDIKRIGYVYDNELFKH